MPRQSNLGRRKYEMKRIPCKRARTIAFSKRCSRLNKMSHELCTQTGCQIALIVFSETGRARSFSHPSLETVTERFLNQSQMPAQHSVGPAIVWLNQKCDKLIEEIDMVKQRSNAESVPVPSWLGSSMGELSHEQLVEAVERMEKLKKLIDERVAKVSPKTVRDFDLNLASPSEDEV